MVRMYGQTYVHKCMFVSVCMYACMYACRKEKKRKERKSWDDPPIIIFIMAGQLRACLPLVSLKKALHNLISEGAPRLLTGGPGLTSHELHLIHGSSEIVCKNGCAFFSFTKKPYQK